jgi:hypothetical protein
MEQNYEVFHSQILSLLNSLGYIPIHSKVQRILRNAIMKSLEIIGKPYSHLLLNKLCLISGLSEKELLTNYDLFEKSLYQIFGDGASIIINFLRKEILPHALLIDRNITVDNILDLDFTVRNILAHIHIAETFEMLKNNAPVHVMYLYENENPKDNTLSTFFDADNIANGFARGLLSDKSERWNLDSAISLSPDRFIYAEKDQGINRLCKWIDKISSYNDDNRQTRIALEDATSVVRNGFEYDNNVLAEQSINKYTQENNMAVLCGYNVSKVSNESLKAIIKTITPLHDYVIVDKPYALYKFS